MSKHTASVVWVRRSGERFVDQKYSREHRWIFDGGLEVPGSASPDRVPVPYSKPECVDPEEGLIAALSSCHMLWFLWLAANAGVSVDEYDDQAFGVLGKNARGRTALTKITLRPRVVFSSDPPDRATIEKFHHEAHDRCFIANSLLSEVVIDLDSVIEQSAR